LKREFKENVSAAIMGPKKAKKNTGAQKDGKEGNFERSTFIVNDLKLLDEHQILQE
jgi:hypothetical protein